MQTALDEFVDRWTNTSPDTVTYAVVREWFTPEREARFWERVDKNGPNGCWLWTGAKWDAGYGRYEVGRHSQRVHRLTYMLARGRDIPELIDERDIPNQPNPELHMKAPVVRHLLCGVALCCNYHHLALGTHLDNRLDRELIDKLYREHEERIYMERQEQLRARYLDTQPDYTFLRLAYHAHSGISVGA